MSIPMSFPPSFPPSFPTLISSSRLPDQLQATLPFPRLFMAGLVLLAVLLADRPAEAQLVVVDPANIAESVRQTAQALEQVRNQLRQLENDARMLARSGLQLAPEARRAVDSAGALFREAQAVNYRLDGLAGEIRTLYPDDYRALAFEDLLKRSDAWMLESRLSVERLVRQQAQAAEGLVGVEGRLGAALEASSEAEGQTSAIQASTQMLGALSAQLAEMQALQVVQSRALAAERLERAAREARSSEIRRRAFPAVRTDAPPARPAF